MRPILFATFIVSMLMAFVGADLLGAVVQRNPSPAKFQQGKPNNKKPNNKKPNNKNSKGKNQNSQKQKTPEQRFREQQAKALEEHRKKQAEEKRRREQASAQRSKELQADKKRRNELRLADFKKDIKSSVAAIGGLERRLPAIKGKHKSLNAAITLITSKATGENVPHIKAQLERMKQEMNKHAEATSGLAGDLSAVKASGSKWSGSGSGGKDDAVSPEIFSKLEKATLQIKRDCSRVEFELKKAETYHKGAVKALFFCVSELVRAGVSFSSEEQNSIRSLAD